MSMGQLATYTCYSCNYSVFTSAGHDCGFVAVTETYICNKCKKIVDVCVGEHGQTYFPGMIRQDGNSELPDSDLYKCPECGSGAELVLWDSRKKPCPKCGSRMKKDPDGEMIMWD